MFLSPPLTCLFVSGFPHQNVRSASTVLLNDYSTAPNYYLGLLSHNNAHVPISVFFPDGSFNAPHHPFLLLLRLTFCRLLSEFPSIVFRSLPLVSVFWGRVTTLPFLPVTPHHCCLVLSAMFTLLFSSPLLCFFSRLSLDLTPPPAFADFFPHPYCLSSTTPPLWSL